MAHDGNSQREAVGRAAEPGPLELTPPTVPTAEAGRRQPPFPVASLGAHKPGGGQEGHERGGRRPAKRRPAGPARPKIAANDDAPSIGGLIFSLQQKPSNRPFQVAAIASGVWLLFGAIFAWVMQASGGSIFSGPMPVIFTAAVSLPIALLWFLAMLAWRTQELKLMSSAMTEVAVRLAEPDRGAEQSAASLGQAVRRQVSFMNEAISRALGRAGELEALVHNEVSALEKSYGENEHKIKGLIQELVGERHALVSTTDKVAETLKSMGSEVPTLIEKLSQQQIKLARIIEGAGQNLIALENQLTTASGSLERTLANRTQQLQAVLDDYTVALDATLANRAEALDMQLVERTRALDAAFSERLSLFDDLMLRSTKAIDHAVNERARALSAALEHHVHALSETLGRQAANLDQSMISGIDEVRRTSDNITRQSLKAIEGLSSQTDLLKGVSENLMSQVSGVTHRFDHQGKSMMTAASALEQANLRIDTTLQRLTGKASQLDDTMRGYSASAEAEQRARHAQAQAAAADMERVRAESDAQTRRTIEDLRAKGSGPNLQDRLRAEADRGHAVTRDSADAMRNALNDQLRALEQLSTLAAQRRDGAAPLAPGGPMSLTATYAAHTGRTAARRHRRSRPRRCRRTWATAGRWGTCWPAPPVTTMATRGRRCWTSRASRAPLIRPRPRPSGPASAPASAASWCAASTRPRGARTSTRCPSATAGMWIFAVPSTVSSPTSSNWCARRSRRARGRCTTTSSPMRAASICSWRMPAAACADGR